MKKNKSNRSMYIIIIVITIVAFFLSKYLTNCFHNSAFLAKDHPTENYLDIDDLSLYDSDGNTTSLYNLFFETQYSFANDELSTSKGFRVGDSLEEFVQLYGEYIPASVVGDVYISNEEQNVQQIYDSLALETEEIEEITFCFGAYILNNNIYYAWDEYMENYSSFTFRDADATMYVSFMYDEVTDQFRCDYLAVYCFSFKD